MLQPLYKFEFIPYEFEIKPDACATHMDALAMTLWCMKHVKASTSCFLISKSTVNVPEMAATCPLPIHCAYHLVQANTELILGFEPSAVTDELVARQQLLWKDWVEGLVSLPINLPGFGNACPLTNQIAYSLLHMHGKIAGQMHNHLSTCEISLLRDSMPSVVPLIRCKTPHW